MEGLTQHNNATFGSLTMGKKMSWLPVQNIIQHNRTHKSGGGTNHYMATTVHLLHTHFKDSLHSNAAPYFLKHCPKNEILYCLPATHIML